MKCEHLKVYQCVQGRAHQTSAEAIILQLRLRSQFRDRCVEQITRVMVR